MRLLLVVPAFAISVCFVPVRTGFYTRDRDGSVPRPAEHSRMPLKNSGFRPSAPGQGKTGHVDKDTRAFLQRLRCVNYRAWLGSATSPEALALLCQRRPLEALQILIPLAQAGDEHAKVALAFIGHIGVPCDSLKPSATFGRYKAVLTARAREKGATDQTLRSESESDVQIEYDRKMLMPGDADGQLKLATELLAKATPQSQAEAIDLLHRAAENLPAAKTELATCMLKGCPTPAMDPGEARALLIDAASSGDRGALLILAGPTGPNSFDLDPSLPQFERYAWGQFLQKLNEAGCFGAAEYVSWATATGTPLPSSDLRPEDSSAAQTRTADLLGSQLDKTKKLMECD
jgi:hypothetical protein